MKISRAPVVTELGELHGRHCIFLDEIEDHPAGACLTLRGDINGHLINPPSEAWISYELTFHGVVQWNQLDLDSSNWDWRSSFEERFGSFLVGEFDPKGSLKLRHFFVQTYDELFDVICEEFSVTFGSREKTTSLLGGHLPQAKPR